MIQPGQINYYKQLQDLSMVPPSAEGVSYLQQLANNPSSPFVKFLVESRLEQITKALNNQKGDQAAPPQGTIKDKIEQSAGIAALQAAQQRQAAQAMQHPQPGAPVPEGVPHPMMQGEPERERGIASTPVDENMFNFAPGGIVAFAKGEKVTDEEKEKEKQKAADRKALLEYPAAALDILQMLPAGAMNLIGSAASGTENVANRIVNALGDTDLSTNLDYNPRFSMTPFTDRLQSSDKAPAPAAAAPAATALVPNNIPGQMTTTNDPRVLPANAPPVVRPLGAAPTVVPPVTKPVVAAPRVPGGIAGPATGALMGPPAPVTGLDAAMLKGIAGGPPDITKMQGYQDYKNAQDKLAGEIKPETKVEDDIANRLKLYQSLGIGKSDEIAEKLIQDRAARYEKTQKARDMNNFIDQLADYAAPGANWSNVVKGEQARRAQQLSADEIFAQEQDKMMLEVVKNKEARTMGALGDVIKEAADKNKNRLEAIKAIATNAGIPLQQATQAYDAWMRNVASAWSTTQNVAAQDRATAAHERVGMAQVAATNAATAMRGDIAAERLDAVLKGLDIKQKALLNNNPEYKKYTDLLVMQEQQLAAVKDEAKKAQIQIAVNDTRAKMADIASRVIGSGIAAPSQTPPPPGGKDKVIDFSKIGKP